MPRYYFNVYDGVSETDQDGTELPNLEEVRVQAITLAGEILRDDSRRFKLGEDWRLEVTDEDGTILFRLDFFVAETPAALGLQGRRPSHDDDRS